jgi:hypothetical protein
VDGEVRDGAGVGSGVRDLLDRGYAFVHAAEMRELLRPFGALTDWPRFAASWNDLEVDAYLADRGRFRKRRYAVYEAAADGTITRQPHEPHHQHAAYNPLFGGVERWFAPVAAAIGESASLLAILRCCHATFGGLVSPSAAGAGWHVEIHQFRIEAQSGAAGHPTPEGVHRDGVDFVLVLLVARSNIASGTTTVHDLDGRELGSFTLTAPLDAALLDDARVAHGVTPVTPLDPTQPAYRDVLVVTFRRSASPQVV